MFLLSLLLFFKMFSGRDWTQRGLVWVKCRHRRIRDHRKCATVAVSAWRRDVEHFNFSMITAWDTFAYRSRLEKSSYFDNGEGHSTPYLCPIAEYESVPLLCFSKIKNQTWNVVIDHNEDKREAAVKIWESSPHSIFILFSVGFKGAQRQTRSNSRLIRWEQFNCCASWKGGPVGFCDLTAAC